MGKITSDAILNFPKNYLISSYLGVTLSSCNIKITFASIKGLILTELKFLCGDD